MEPDLNLVLRDFVEAFRRDKKQALADLQALLLDETVCAGRVAFLKRLLELGETVLPPELTAAGAPSFEPEIQRLVELGVARATGQGAVSLDRLAALTCDADALWRAHKALTATATGAAPPSPERTQELDRVAKLAREVADLLVSPKPAAARRTIQDELRRLLQRVGLQHGSIQLVIHNRQVVKAVVTGIGRTTGVGARPRSGMGVRLDPESLALVILKLAARHQDTCPIAFGQVQFEIANGKISGTTYTSSLRPNEEGEQGRLCWFL